jgi:chemotaxis protein methyltransferase CheR
MRSNAQKSEEVEHTRPWFDVIRQATANVARITGGKLAPASTASLPTDSPGTALAPVAPQDTALRLAIPLVAPHCDSAVPLELMRAERFQQALELLQALPADSGADSDTQLLLAVLLANGGDAPGAETICRRILDMDEINAGAYYVMALCREQAGDREIAMEHDQAAAYLDPGFAMPHLHLGLLAKRSADWQRSRRELANAQRLLKTEDAARILLFGGGFKREALLEMCRVELRMCGRHA